LHSFLEVVLKWEWLLLLAVGILEVLILWNVSKEKREREKLIVEMQHTRVELGRENYLSMIRDTLGKSKHYVYYVSHSLTSGMTDHEKNEMYERIPSNLDHRCITGKDPGKIKYMWEQRRQGIEMRVNDYVMQSTFRFQVSDDIYAVLGFADQGATESRKGILIDNLFFCRMLKRHFLRLWDESVPLDLYLLEVLRITSGPEISSTLEDNAREWDLKDEEVEHLRKLVKESEGHSSRPGQTEKSQVGEQSAN